MTNVLDLDSLLNEISSGDLDKDQLNIIIKVLYHINQEIVISKKGQTIKLNLSSEDIDFALSYLQKKELIQIDHVNDVEIYSLTDKTKTDFNDVLKHLHLYQQFQNLIKTIEIESSVSHDSLEEDIPSFIGCFIADKAGKTLLTFELYEGALESFIKGQVSDEELNPEFDIELIPMFVSALEKFSKNINLKQLSELHLTGINLKIQTFSYEKFTVTFFINPRINLEILKPKIKDYFMILFDKYKDEFELTLRTGVVDNISHLNKLGKEMLKELNKYVYLVEFKNIVIALDNYDTTHARTLYNKLNELHNDAQLKFSLTIEKIKKLKVYLLKTMLNDDLEELKDIINKTQAINSKLNLL